MPSHTKSHEVIIVGNFFKTNQVHLVIVWMMDVMVSLLKKYRERIKNLILSTRSLKGHERMVARCSGVCVQEVL